MHAPIVPTASGQLLTIHERSMPDISATRTSATCIPRNAALPGDSAP